MNGYFPRDVLKNGLSAIGASQTDAAISEPFVITANGSKALVVKIKVSAATVSSGITAKLQTGIDQEWVDSKTVAISATGAFYIKLLAENSSDQSFLPLLRSGRIVVSTGSGDSVTFSKIQVLQDE
jgi:hypothetical protein